MRPNKALVSKLASCKVCVLATCAAVPPLRWPLARELVVSRRVKQGHVKHCKQTGIAFCTSPLYTPGRLIAYIYRKALRGRQTPDLVLFRSQDGLSSGCNARDSDSRMYQKRASALIGTR